ncbi:cation/multidrug efflux pump [Terriglobus roseus DSM 18391]|uniref:Cation/multidrug efflux pump n=1 Tax=Terriglobus roseus (strain DSM 18391 / NRRL B-41598 / KBS 63) TaxID=926566 RepID=I3ZHG1_TERRK|nr:efflux RND transporter permease subunit [Terriglobus roseus]AFL88336.1 cation/multidrug efflux pump [Terriglobus roseus DSM 18391]AFL88679.1 cation/multidrug efflux pump [Terriglobus roseus DSM 18391]
MNISAPAIRRPIATILLTAALGLAGTLAFNVLPVSPLPQIDSPTISVSAQLPGASPDVMAAAVATPLERQFGHIAGVTEMTSQSSTGSSSISLQFDLSKNVNAAAREVQAAISAARTYLPTNLPSNPVYRKVNSADAPIAILGIESDTYAVGALYDSASTILQQKIAQIKGVGQITIGGSTLPAVRVEINPLQLEHYGLSLADVATFLKNQNAHTPTGALSDGQTMSYITVNDQLSKAEDYRKLVVSTRNGAAVRLEDIAEVVDSTENLHSSGYVNGRKSVDLIIFKQPGANIIETVDRINAQLPALRSAIPAGQSITKIMDATTTIRASLRDTELTLLLSILLVILVVFVFLRDWRATIIPGIAVPTSLIGTFGAMYLLHYSLDNLSLMALTISTGFVIDDAIVVMENITRYVEEGVPPLEAAYKGAKEIGFTVISITASLLAVFIPILMMGGIIGRLFREFAVTLSIAIFISMVLSLTTTPMLCSLLLKPREKSEHGRLYRFVESCFDWLRAMYERSLRWVIRDHAVLVLAVFLFTIGLNVVYLMRVSKGLFPQQDTGLLMGAVMGPQDASFQMMDGATKKSVEIVRADPAVQNVIGFTGGGISGTSNNAFMFVVLKPLDERKLSATAVLNRLRPKLMVVKEAQTFLMAAQEINLGARQSNAQYQYTLQADSTSDLKKYVPLLTREMKKLSLVADVNSDLQSGGLEAYLTYDRRTAARLGIMPSNINDALNYSFSQAQTSTIYKPLNQYHVILEAQQQFTQSPATLRNTYVQTASGSVPLSAISTYKTLTAPLSVNHSGLYPSSTISFNLAGGTSIEKATSEVHALETQLHIPKSVHGAFSGTAQLYQASIDSEPILIATAIFAVYIVLGVLYESFIHPITILTTLPSASLGAVITLVLFHAELDVISLIGIILLIGIVKKNAIMMIDFALQLEREQNLPPEDAIFQACILRFRPILMTTAAAFFGAVPLAFGSGIGSEFRRPLGLTILGGLLVSQVLTLYTTPVVYLMLDRLRHRFGRKQSNHPHAIAAQGAL